MKKLILFTFILFSSPLFAEEKKCCVPQTMLPVTIGVASGLAADAAGLLFWKLANDSFFKDSYQVTRGVAGGLIVSSTMLVGAYAAKFITERQFQDFCKPLRAKLGNDAFNTSTAAAVGGMCMLLAHKICTATAAFIAGGAAIAR